MHDTGLSRLIDNMLDKRGRVIYSLAQCYGVSPFFRTHDANDVEVLAVVDKLFHVALIVGLVDPYLVLLVVLVVARRIHKLHLYVEDVVVRSIDFGLGSYDIFLVGELPHHFLELFRVAQTQYVRGEIANAPRLRKDEDKLVFFLGPMAAHDIELRLDDGIMRGHFIERIG